MSHLLSAQTRRERIRDYKQSFPRLGVYAVRCSTSGAAWVGASRNVDGALNRIRFELAQGAHRDTSLAQAWRLYGAGAFTFEVLDRVKQRDDPAFDYEAELQSLLALWRLELSSQEARHE